MERDKRCSFAGHRDVYDKEVLVKIRNVAEKLIVEDNVTEFLVGNYGRFDRYCATVVQELKKIYKNISLTLVLPFFINDINEYKNVYKDNYDSIVIADIPPNTPKRFSIIKANEYIIGQSDFLICYVEFMYGGAFRTYEFAKRKKIPVFNIAQI